MRVRIQGGYRERPDLPPLPPWAPRGWAYEVGECGRCAYKFKWAVAMNGPQGLLAMICRGCCVTAGNGEQERYAMRRYEHGRKQADPQFGHTRDPSQNSRREAALLPEGTLGLLHGLSDDELASCRAAALAWPAKRWPIVSTVREAQGVLELGARPDGGREGLAIDAAGWALWLWHSYPDGTHTRWAPASRCEDAGRSLFGGPPHPFAAMG